MMIEIIWERINQIIDEELEIIDFVIGAKYSYAVIQGKMGEAMGTAYLPCEDITRGYSRIPKIDYLTSMLTSTNIGEKSLGVALMNAISQYLLWNRGDSKKFKVEYGNIVDLVQKFNPEPKNITIVGNMVPLIEKLKKSGFEPVVLERNPRMRFGALPDCFASRILPKTRYAIVTGATLVNDTIDFILSLLRNSEKTMLVGPTAAVYPIKDEKITHIASMRIMDIEKTAEIIRLGGGRWDFSKYAKEYIITIKD